ncbi:MAG TPA: RecQ family ATP-dependent DNA helicase [Tepidisphaeraceae bacterium]|nr:RecQ family ATP-dependent DNA helicase [Tepidisphaeraceae bacterium]
MPTTSPDAKRIRQIAKQRFGYDALRSGQEEAIRLVLSGHDVLSVMPTGSGKSAIYQIAALLIDGPTVVISPLIALQKDQVGSIQDQDLPDAAVLNSTLRVSERRETLEKLEGGELEFLFLSPEQLANEETFDRLLENKPTLFVVDEAHCISEWGHDFRPEYSRLGTAIDALGHPRVLALTATASPNVRENIVERLNMRNPRTVVWGFDRPNIWLGVETCPDESTKDRVLLDRVRDMEKPMIVYVGTHRHAEETCKRLSDEKIDAGFYHGGMKKTERDAVQDAFMSGNKDVIVATNAFGMGVDKADVRTVIHYDISESIDAYYQEVGRAGRDGKPSRALLLYRPEDVGMRRAQAAGGKLSESQVEQVVEAVSGSRTPVDPKDVQEATDLSQGKVNQAINRLADVGAVSVLPGGEVLPAKTKIDPQEVAEEVVHEHEMYRKFRVGRVELMKDYAETRDCRRRYILNYFGEPFPDPCGHCDNCEIGAVEKQDEQNASVPFPIKSRVTHKKYGEGIVMAYEGDKIVVLFDTEGSKSLVTSFVQEHGLLEKI